MAFSLPKDPEQQKRLLIGMVPLLLLFGYYQFMHGKKVAANDLLQTRFEELDQRNKLMRPQALTGGAELQQKLALYEQHMKRLEELIPQSEEVPELLNSMSERAQDATVDLALLRPETEAPGQFYTEQSYQIAVHGTYHDIGRYLAMIASLRRIITPVELKLRPHPNDTLRDGTPRLEADFRIMTYVIPPVQTPTTPVGPGAAPQGGANGQH
ncbi:MAG TPA: type 4a pilus biogenesis protein PilO [Longimicrobiales bacterium]